MLLIIKYNGDIGINRYSYLYVVVFSFQIVIYFIVSAACGGLDWPCTRSK